MTTRLTLQGKVASERNQRIFTELLRDPNNAICADCRSPGPCWASFNLGIFLCMRCAGVHRKIGTHITKVKSLTLDTWTTEQIDNLKKLGNKHVNFYFNPQPERHPIPHGEKEMEKYIRDKYERKLFMNKESIVRKTTIDSPKIPSQSNDLLIKLRELGFSDNSRNEQALAKANNNIEMAIHLLSSTPAVSQPQSTLSRATTYSEGTIKQSPSYQRPVPLRRNTATQPIPDTLDPNMFDRKASPLSSQTTSMNSIPPQSFNTIQYSNPNPNQFTNAAMGPSQTNYNGNPQFQGQNPQLVQGQNPPNRSFSAPGGFYSNQPMYTNNMQPQPGQFKHQINKDYIMSLYSPGSGPSHNQESNMNAFQQFPPGPQQGNSNLAPQHQFMNSGQQQVYNNHYQMNQNTQQQPNSQQSGDWWN